MSALGASPIPRLLKSGGPSAIGWLVMPIVVDTLNGQATRLRAHVGKELFKCGPLVADPNATSAVVLIADVLGVCAARPHVAPSLVSGGLRHPVRGEWTFSVPVATAESLPAQASAALANAGSQAWAKYGAFSTAITTTEPAAIAAACYDGPASKPETGNIDFFWHMHRSLPRKH